MRRYHQKLSKVATALVAAVSMVATLDAHAVWQGEENPGEASKATQATKPNVKVYIVQMAEEPVATYQGGDSRFAAT